MDTIATLIRTRVARYRAALAIQRSFDDHSSMSVVCENPHCTVRFLPYRYTLLIALRGSSTMNDYTSAALTESISMDVDDDSNTCIDVHLGVWMLAQVLHSVIGDDVIHLLSMGMHVIIAGHSLGGAVAALFAHQLIQRDNRFQTLVNVYTFGALPFIYQQQQQQQQNPLSTFNTMVDDTYFENDWVADTTILREMMFYMRNALYKLVEARHCILSRYNIIHDQEEGNSTCINEPYRALKPQCKSQHKSQHNSQRKPTIRVVPNIVRCGRPNVIYPNIQPRFDSHSLQSYVSYMYRDVMELFQCLSFHQHNEELPDFVEQTAMGSWFIV